MEEHENDFQKELMREWIALEKTYATADLYELQTDKLGQVNDLIGYCRQFADDHAPYCRFRHYNISPEYGFSGSVSLAFSSELNIGEHADDMAQFKTIIDLCDGLNIEPFGEEESFLNFFVLDLWKPKKPKSK